MPLVVIEVAHDLVKACLGVNWSVNSAKQAPLGRLISFEQQIVELLLNGLELGLKLLVAKLEIHVHGLDIGCTHR